MSAEVWLITGAQASGKSTVAELLARSFERGAHVRGGQFARWAVSGWVPFDDPARQPEAQVHLELRYRLSASVAVQYAAAGFTCVVQDNVYGPDVVTWLAAVRPLAAHLVVLRPTVSVLAERERDRRARTGKIAYRGAFTPEINDAHVARTPRGLGLWLDTSNESAARTVEQILARSEESLVDSTASARAVVPAQPS